jgi:hypothetical protein
MFKEMWLPHEGFDEMIKKSWEDRSSGEQGIQASGDSSERYQWI